ncbi:MAG: hypothetical protein A3C36_08005 [Omnitrophica WOR_2 bacterium RIFCSPHIGHO2_02_FULL_52_10]|nr:MAG: hypothetical protein A3C36_08005 [Omnitrophica WOR_2 bacterium RIFCSPHIGHO2_02_FULL_52_10]
MKVTIKPNREGGEMKKLFLVGISIILMAAIAGCGTVKGIGEDLSAVGGWLTKGSEKAKE